MPFAASWAGRWTESGCGMVARHDDPAGPAYPEDIVGHSDRREGLLIAMLLQFTHDFEHVLSELERVDAIGLPFIMRPLLHIGLHLEPPELSLAPGAGNLVEDAGRN